MSDNQPTPSKYSMMRLCDAIAMNMQDNDRLEATGLALMWGGNAFFAGAMLMHKAVSRSVRVAALIPVCVNTWASGLFAYRLWATRDCRPNGDPVVMNAYPFGGHRTYWPARWEITDMCHNGSEAYRAVVEGPRLLYPWGRYEFTQAEQAKP